MIINKHSKLILMVAIALTINQKIYSAEQQEVQQPDDEITAPADSTNQIRSATNAATYSLIPDYGKNINSMAVAELNRHLQMHGYYEFAPATYADITRQTQKYGMPIDVSFSRETQRATVTWNKEGVFCCFPGKEKIKIFETTPIEAVSELNIAKPAIPRKRPSTTPLVQPVSAHQAAYVPVERSVFEKPPVVVPKPQTPFPVARQINRSQPHKKAMPTAIGVNTQQQHRMAMSVIDARNMLYFGFAQFTEIAQNHYIALEQSNQIIRDLMQYGPAKFEPRIDSNSTLFLAVIWGQSEKYYKITYNGQR